jgi:hypothetical protein
METPESLPFLRSLLDVHRRMSAVSLARMVYGADAGEDYIQDKAIHIRRDFLGWACSLDSTRIRNLATLIDVYQASNAD